MSTLIIGYFSFFWVFIVSLGYRHFKKRITNHSNYKPNSSHNQISHKIARQLAEKQGRPRMSAQAVGGAVGHNKISIIIPCHRVVGTGGSLTGYAGGIDRKVKLLALEHADMTRFFVPKTGTAL